MTTKSNVRRGQIIDWIPTSLVRPKVIIRKSRSEVSLEEQDTFECVIVAYLKFIIELLKNISDLFLAIKNCSQK